jgi:peroxiredoxin
MLLRDDIGRQVGVDSSQKKKLAELAEVTDKAKLEYTKAQYSTTGATKQQQQAVVDALQAENKFLASNVRKDQMQKLQTILGDPFDTGSLKRIYPMAPEFAEVEHWINSEPLTLKELRGNVVLVHFYAFQCHNCHANFGIYKKWHEELTSKGVRVIGIQSPETRPEEDPVAVREAAQETGLEFPIIIDLEKDNWKNWGNTMWPTVYVIDQDGYIRHWQMGELQWKGANYDKDVQRVIDELLQSS